MCTLSWLPSNNGYWLLFNRDERTSRPRAFPPRRLVLDRIRMLAPVDAAAGGTWIGVNEWGVGAALLNRYDDAPIDLPAGSVSRGILLRSLLTARSARGLIADVAARNLTPFQPFTVAAFDRRPLVRLADWTGRSLTTDSTTDAGLVRTSSGRDQRQAEAVRADALARLVGVAPFSVDRLERFHRSHYPERGPFSVCMHRDEAATRSLTIVRVGRRRATMWYGDGSPCHAPVVTRRQLPLSR